MTQALAKTSKKSPDFRAFLQAELLRRTRHNPRFSLRAFARMLGVQSGFLSKMLRGERRITPATVHRFGLKLGLSLTEIEEYARLCDSRHGAASMTFNKITLDHFQMISEWYHFAILELAAIEGFEPSIKWVARALGLTTAETKAAVDRLVRLGYLAIGESGQWEILEGHTTTLGSEETASALRRMQKQILEMAIASLESVPVERRDQTAMTMAIDSSLIPEAKERITKFRRELCAFLESGKSKDAVYQLSVSLYPVSETPEQKDLR